MLSRLSCIAAVCLALIVAPGSEGSADSGFLYVGPGGAPSAPCTRAAPCRSFDRAYRLARAGQTVLVAPGTYVDQVVQRKPGKPNQRPVLFRPLGSRYSVTVAGSGLTVWGDGLEFRDFLIPGGWYAKPHSANLTFRNIRAKDFFISGARNIRILGGSVGPGVDYHPIIAPEDTVAPTNILIDGVTFHDWTRSNDSVHSECLQVASPNGFTLRRSRFKNCAIFSVFITHWGNSGHPRDVLIENNVFDHSVDGTYSIRFADYPATIENVLIRYNSAVNPINVDPKPRLVNVRMIGNVAPLPRWGCESKIVYRHNVWAGTRCHPTDVNAQSGFRDHRRLDFRLRRGAAGINRGDPQNFPVTDITGRRRPLGGRPDAGAFEMP